MDQGQGDGQRGIHHKGRDLDDEGRARVPTALDGAQHHRASAVDQHGKEDDGQGAGCCLEPGRIFKERGSQKAWVEQPAVGHQENAAEVNDEQPAHHSVQFLLPSSAEQAAHERPGGLLHALGHHKGQHEEVARDVAHLELEHANLLHQEEEQAPGAERQGQLGHHRSGELEPATKLFPGEQGGGPDSPAVVPHRMADEDEETGAFCGEAGPRRSPCPHGGNPRCAFDEQGIADDVDGSGRDHGPHQNAGARRPHEEGIEHHHEKGGQVAPFPDAHEFGKDAARLPVPEDACEAGLQAQGDEEHEAEAHHSGHPESGGQDVEGLLHPAFTQPSGDQDLSGVAESRADHGEGDVEDARIAGAIERDIGGPAQEIVVGQDDQELHEGAGRDRQGEAQDGPVIGLQGVLGHAEGAWGEGGTSPERRRSRRPCASFTVREAQSPRMRGCSDSGRRQSMSLEARTRRVTVWRVNAAATEMLKLSVKPYMGVRTK